MLAILLLEAQIISFFNMRTEHIEKRLHNLYSEKKEEISKFSSNFILGEFEWTNMYSE